MIYLNYNTLHRTSLLFSGSYRISYGNNSCIEKFCLHQRIVLK